MPRSPAQLYGLTFYVEDPGRAAVWLDDRPVTMLTRNPPDETGRPSVTIAACEIRTTVFNRLDPAVPDASAAAVRGGRWMWHDGDGDQPSHGRLICDGGGMCTLRVPLHGLAPDGAQLLSFLLRRDAGAQFALFFRTVSGGCFYFGDTELIGQVSGVSTAAYTFGQHPRPPGEWQQLVAPFHDLSWGSGAEPGGPMPNHALASVTLVCDAAGGSGVNIAQLMFLRPRATALPTERLFCIAGCAPGFENGQPVHLEPVAPAADAALRQTAELDVRGFFCFAGVPSGLYRIWTVGAAGERCNRRGLVADVDGDIVNLVLDRPVRRQEL